DNVFVLAAQIRGIDGQIGHFPQIGRMARGQAFLDSVLVGTGKSREYQFATVRMARVDWQLVAVLDGADNRIDVRKIQSGVDTLAVEIQCQSYKVDVTRAL